MSDLTILLATDFSDDCRRLPASMLNLFGERLSEVILLHVLPRSIPIFPIMSSGSTLVAPPISTKSVPDTAAENERERLEELRRNFIESVRVSTVLKQGSPAHIICETAEELGADLILLASHGRRFLRRLLLGSTTRYVMHHAPCDVLILRPDPNAGNRESGNPLIAGVPEDFPAVARRHPIPSAAGRVA